MLRQAELAEALGYDVLWAHEHHAGAMMYPSPLMTLAALAPATRRIGLGTNMLLLPLYHPLRVAEDGAMVDVMSGGRLRLGVSAELGVGAGDPADRPRHQHAVAAALSSAAGSRGRRDGRRHVGGSAAARGQRRARRWRRRPGGSASAPTCCCCRSIIRCG